MPKQRNIEEWRKKFVAKMKGRKRPPFSEEWKKNMSIAKKGCIPWNKGLRGLKFSPSGENHYRWNNNREEVKYDRRNDPEYKQWRKQVWIRDGYKCRINNLDCKGRIETHHILSWQDFPELRYNINNGIILCQAHHPRKRAEEKRLIPFFQGLVPVSN